MKNRILVFLLLIMITNLIFCQENEEEVDLKKNPQKVILIPIGLAFSFGEQFGFGFLTGGAYESVINNYFSLIGGVNYSFYSQYSIYDHRFSLFGQFRFYPQGNSPMKFFISAQIAETIILISYHDNNAISYITSISPLLGYKFNPDKKRFFCELWLGYNFKFGNMNYPKDVSYINGIFDNLIIITDNLPHGNLIIGTIYGFKLK